VILVVKFPLPKTRKVHCSLRYICLLSIAVASGLASPAQVEKMDSETAVKRAYACLYNFDFNGAQEILDRQRQVDPREPLLASTKAGAYLFSELDRLRILELDFFVDDEKVVDRRKLVLGLIRAQGAITPAQYRQALAEKVNLTAMKKPNEAAYFLAALHSNERAAMAYDGWLVGHARWFRSSAGRKLLDAIQSWAGHHECTR